MDIVGRPMIKGFALQRASSSNMVRTYCSQPSAFVVAEILIEKVILVKSR